jgi:putative Holliday junction resolvase
MRYLGIDYGTKRVGVALSDEGGSMAFPHAVIENTPALADELEALVAHEHVEAIVIGHSLNTKNEPNPAQEEIESLIGDLTLRTGLPIHLEPEQYTTQEALRTQGRTSMTDAAAATIILNSFLTKHA